MSAGAGDRPGAPTSGDRPDAPARPVPVPPRADVVLMPGYHSPRLDVEVRLNVNEAPEPPPAGYLEALEAELATIPLNRYPDRDARDLRRDLAELHGVAPEQVYCANGSNEVIQSLLLAYGGPGRSVAVFEPTYALHSHIARVTGTAVVAGERDAEYLVEAGELARVLAEAGRSGPGNPVVTFLCSPNNPTARLEPPEVVEQVLHDAPGLVVVDEAYGQFAPRSAMELLDAYPHLVVIRTFSKTWSLAALRLGYAVAAPEVVDAMVRVTLPYHLDAAKQAAGRVALRFAGEMRARVARLVEERGRLVAALSDLGAEVVPSDANFVLFRPPRREAVEVWKFLVERSVLVRDVSSWPRLSGFLRVTVGTRAENDAFLNGLRGAVG